MPTLIMPRLTLPKDNREIVSLRKADRALSECGNKREYLQIASVFQPILAAGATTIPKILKINLKALTQISETSHRK